MSCPQPTQSRAVSAVHASEDELLPPPPPLTREQYLHLIGDSEAAYCCDNYALGCSVAYARKDSRSVYLNMHRWFRKANKEKVPTLELDHNSNKRELHLTKEERNWEREWAYLAAETRREQEIRSKINNGTAVD